MKKVIMILLLGVIGICTLTSCDKAKGYLESLYNEADNFFNGGSKASTSSSSNIPVPSSSSSSSSNSSSSESEIIIDNISIAFPDNKMQLLHTSYSIYQMDDFLYIDDIEIGYEAKYYNFYKETLSIQQESWIASIIDVATVILYSDTTVVDSKQYQDKFSYFQELNVYEAIKYKYYDDCLVYSHKFAALGFPFHLQFNITVYPV